MKGQLRHQRRTAKTRQTITPEWQPSAPLTNMRQAGLGLAARLVKNKPGLFTVAGAALVLHQTSHLSRLV